MLELFHNDKWTNGQVTMIFLAPNSNLAHFRHYSCASYQYSDTIELLNCCRSPITVPSKCLVTKQKITINVMYTNAIGREIYSGQLLLIISLLLRVNSFQTARNNKCYVFVGCDKNCNNLSIRPFVIME